MFFSREFSEILSDSIALQYLEFLTEWGRRTKAERGEQVAENEAGNAKSVVDGIRQRHAKPQPADSRQHSAGNSKMICSILRIMKLVCVPPD